LDKETMIELWPETERLVEVAKFSETSENQAITTWSHHTRK
jgi:hypothetical protein